MNVCITTLWNFFDHLVLLHVSCRACALVRFYCPVEFTGLLSWSLEQKGLKVFRSSLIMARGPYEHTPWPNADGHVVAPSTTGY